MCAECEFRNGNPGITKGCEPLIWQWGPPGPFMPGPPPPPGTPLPPPPPRSMPLWPSVLLPVDILCAICCGCPTGIGPNLRRKRRRKHVKNKFNKYLFTSIKSVDLLITMFVVPQLIFVGIFVVAVARTHPVAICGSGKHKYMHKGIH